jgi:DNA-binding transcriptional LysR family regulator
LINVADFWSGLDLRQIAAFSAVAESGSFATAARQLGYTQPAVSHQVATLERIIGHRLLDRSRGRSQATLTPAGVLFARHVEALSTRFASARADLDALASDGTAVIRVGAFQSVSAGLLPRLVARLTTTASAVSVDLSESADERDLLERLARGELDFAFTLLPLEDERFSAEELMQDPYYVVRARTSEAAPAINSLSDLDGARFIAPRTCRSSDVIDARLRAAGTIPTYTFRTDDNSALLAFVRNGAGVAFVTKLTLETVGVDLDATPVDHLVPARRIALTWSRDRELLPLQERFLAAARQTCAELKALC